MGGSRHSRNRWGAANPRTRWWGNGRSQAVRGTLLSSGKQDILRLRPRIHGQIRIAVATRMDIVWMRALAMIVRSDGSGAGAAYMRSCPRCALTFGLAVLDNFSGLDR